MSTNNIQRIIAGLTSLSLAITPLMVNAEMAGAVDTETANKFISQSRNLSILETRLRDIEQSNVVQQEMIKALTKMLKESGQLKGVSEKQKQKIAKSVAENTDETAKKLMIDIAEHVKSGDWTKDLEDNEILSHIKKLTEQSEKLKKYIDLQRDRVNNSISSVCGTENPQTWKPLIKAGLTNIPDHWSTNFAANARSLGVELPPCFNKKPPNSDTTVAQDIDRYQKTIDSGKELQFAISNMMMMAMSTGNPYIIAAAMVLRAIMAIFSDGGGDGEGDGEGDGSGDDGGGDGSGYDHGKNEGKGASSRNVESSTNNQGQQGNNNQQPSETLNPESQNNNNNGSSEGINVLTVGSVQVTRQDNDSIAFFDTNKGERPFILKWNRILDVNENSLGSMPWPLTIRSANVGTKVIIIDNFMIKGVAYEIKITPHSDKRNYFTADVTEK